MSDVIKRKLASIQKIVAIEPIAGADRIEKATVLGWHLVVQKNEFKPNDKCVYIEIDSLLPDTPQFAFLKDPKGKVPEEGFVHRLRTKKLKGIVSQGLVMPLSAFSATIPVDVKIGEDVTEYVGVKKYEPPVQETLKLGQAKSTFPSFIPKTDEIRVQSIPWIVDAFHHAKAYVYVTVKLDGTSATYYLNDGQFGVCSRNQEWKRPVQEPAWRKRLGMMAERFGMLKVIRKYGYLRAWQDGARNTYWEVSDTYSIESLMNVDQFFFPGNYAIQGEICGPGIQKNRLGLKKVQFFVFDVYDIDKRQYLNYHDQRVFTARLGLSRVPEVGTFEFPWKTVDEVLMAADGKYDNGHQREGIVIRTIGETVWQELGRGSFKAISNLYLLAESKGDKE